MWVVLIPALATLVTYRNHAICCPVHFPINGKPPKYQGATASTSSGTIQNLYALSSGGEISYGYLITAWLRATKLYSASWPLVRQLRECQTLTVVTDLNPAPLEFMACQKPPKAESPCFGGSCIWGAARQARAVEAQSILALHTCLEEKTGRVLLFLGGRSWLVFTARMDIHESEQTLCLPWPLFILCSLLWIWESWYHRGKTFRNH